MQVFWIILDGTRAVDGAHKFEARKPLKDEYNDGLFFNKVYTAAPSSAMSWLATLTSNPIYYYSNDYVSCELKEDDNIFPAILEKNGYSNTLFIANYMVRSRVVNYFDQSVYNLEENEQLREFTDNEIMALFENYINSQSKTNNKLFSIIHLIEPDTYELNYDKIISLINKNYTEDEYIIVVSGDHGYDHVVFEGASQRHDLLLTQANILTKAKIVGKNIKPKIINSPIILLDLPVTILNLIGVENSLQNEFSKDLTIYLDDTKNELEIYKDRFFRIDNRFFKQSNRKSSLILDHKKIVVEHSNNEIEYFELSDDYLNEKLVEYDNSFSILEEQYNLTNKLISNKNDGNVVKLEEINIYDNILHGFRYNLEKEINIDYDKSKSNLLIFRTFNIEAIKKLLDASLEYFLEKNIYMALQDFIQKDLVDYPSINKTIITPSYFDVDKAVSELKDNNYTVALVPYNGDEFIRYIHVFEVLAKLNIEQIIIVNILGHMTKVDSAEKMLNDMYDYRDNFPRYKKLNDIFFTHGAF